MGTEKRVNDGTRMIARWRRRHFLLLHLGLTSWSGRLVRRTIALREESADFFEKSLVLQRENPKPQADVSAQLPGSRGERRK